MQKKYKTAKVIKPYLTKMDGYEIVVPIGATVSNSTACGMNDNYRFWIDWQEYARKLTGFPNSMLAHDLTYYGLSIPAEYCEPYVADFRHLFYNFGLAFRLNL